MNENNGFTFFRSYYEVLKKLDAEPFKKMVCAMCELALNNKEEKLEGSLDDFFTLMKPNIITNVKKRSGGHDGGRPTKDKTIGYNHRIKPKGKTYHLKDTDTDKKRKGEDINIVLPFGIPFREKWNKWNAYRKEIGKPYKSKQSEAEILNQLSKYDEPFVIKIIEQSISNQWQGLIFPQTEKQWQDYQLNKKTNGQSYDQLADKTAPCPSSDHFWSEKKQRWVADPHRTSRENPQYIGND